MFSNLTPVAGCGDRLAIVTDEDANREVDFDGEPERGIFHGFSGYVTPTKEDWNRVLSGGLIAVDTNVLLNLYRYNQAARTALLATLQKFGDRLWVPHQVMEEFWRNRESALRDPGRQLQQSVDALKSDLEKSYSDLRQWVNRVSLDRVNANRLESTLRHAFNRVITEMSTVVDSSGVEMEEDTTKDAVVSALAHLLQGKVGAPLDSKKHAAAIIEGKRRVQERIPPAYEDKKKQSRNDGSETGDYLVWCQLILEAKRRGGDVLLVTGDIKEDWWRMRNGLPIGPRNELAEEMLRESGARLYMLKPDRLLTYARDFLRVAVSEGSLQNVEMVDTQSDVDHSMQRIEGMDGSLSDAIVRSWIEVEKAAARVMAENLPRDQSKSVHQIIRDLVQQRFVPREILATVLWLGDARNNVVHGRSATLTQEGVNVFLSGARDVVVALSPLFTAHGRAMRFERVIADIAIAAGLQVDEPAELADLGYDLLVTAPDRPKSDVIVQVKYRSRGPFGLTDLMREVKVLEKLTDLTSMVIVTNALIVGGAKDFMGETGRRQIGNVRHVEVLQWRGVEDDSLVVRALQRAMG
jgi:hypothetical protein